MALTQRDMDLLHAVHRYRFLRSTHLTALVAGSAQAVLRRLQLLFHHGYLDRPVVQLDWYTTGSQPLVYALARRGAKAIGADAPGRAGRRRSANNRGLSRVFLHHALEVAEVMVGVELACRRHDIAFVSPEEVLVSAPERTRLLRRPFRWHVTVRSDGQVHELGIEPDMVFGLRLARQRGAPRELFFFLEADRGTMPVSRKSLQQTSVLRKILVYRETWSRRVHEKHFGIPNFRVLVVTPTEARAARLVKVSRRANAGGWLLVSDVESLRGQDALAHEWVNGRGEIAAILRMEERPQAPQIELSAA